MSELKIDKVSPRTGNYVSLNTVGMKNIFINGDMSIAQRGTSTSGLGADSSQTYVLDRFKFQVNGALSTARYTVSQDTDVPSGQGFAKSSKIDVTTADASLNAAYYLFYRQEIEGQNLQYLKKGTANAESVTMSFWVKSNKTGTYICEIDDNDNSRNINKSYTINSADTWEKKTITFAGDTTGTLDNDNGSSFRIFWWLGAGTDYTSGTLATDWEATTAANRAVGQVNLADNTANYINITGVQLEAGTTASDFEFLPVDVNLQRCLRYFYKWVSIAIYNNLCMGRVTAGTEGRGVYAYPEVMRTTPSLSADGNFRVVADNAVTLTGGDVTLARANTNTTYIQMQGSGSAMTTGQCCEMGANNDSDAEISFSAEL
jgi:hypothetical protein